MSLQKIPTRQLGRNGPIIGAIALGTMSFGKFYGSHDDEEAYETLSRAVDRGMTYWETADVFGDSEKLIGQWFSRTGRRSEVFLGTSFGSFDPEKPYHGPDPDSSPANIHKSIARSMRFLNTNYIDLYTQGRVDPKVPIEVVMKTLGEYIDKGVIRWIGLSECSAEVLRRAKAVPSVGEKVIAVQREYSPFDLGIERDGFMQCAKEVGITVVPYSPFGRGLATGRFRSKEDFEQGDLRPNLPWYSEENMSKNLELVDKLKAIGDKYNVSSPRVILAWMLAEHNDLIPLPGCKTAARVEDNASAAELQLTPEDVNEIRRLCENADVRGDRLPERLSASMDCISLEEWKDE